SHGELLGCPVRQVGPQLGHQGLVVGRRASLANELEVPLDLAEHVAVQGFSRYDERLLVDDGAGRLGRRVFGNGHGSSSLDAEYSDERMWNKSKVSRWVCPSQAPSEFLQAELSRPHPRSFLKRTSLAVSS